MSGPSDYKPSHPALQWFERRLPILSLMHSSFVAYPTPRNLNYWWTFGAILSFMLGMQILTGVILAMHYTPHADLAFKSVARIVLIAEIGEGARRALAETAGFGLRHGMPFHGTRWELCFRPVRRSISRPLLRQEPRIRRDRPKGVVYCPQVGNNLGTIPGHRADSFRSGCHRRGFGHAGGGAGSSMEGTSGAADLALLRGSTGGAALALDVSAQATRRGPARSSPSRGSGLAWWDRQRRRPFTGAALARSDSPAGVVTVS